MKTTEIHDHMLKILYKITSVLMFTVGLIITIHVESACWNFSRIYTLTHCIDEIIVGVIAFIGGFYFMYKVRHYDADKEGD